MVDVLVALTMKDNSSNAGAEALTPRVTGDLRELARKTRESLA
jgi:hypothetical protein